MNISPVSFGKTVKVYAPFHDAVRIANAANGAPCTSPEIQENLKNIFNDTKEGHALAFYFDDNKKTGYIFSGKESREFQRSLYIKALEVRKTKLHDPLRTALRNVIQSKYDHYKRTNEIIKKSEEPFALKIGKDGSSIEIKAI